MLFINIRDILMKLVVCKGKKKKERKVKDDCDTSDSSTEKKIRKLKKQILQHELDNIEHNIKKRAVKRVYDEIDEPELIFGMSM